MRRWLLVALCVSLVIFVTVSAQQHQIASRGELQRHSHFVRHLHTFLDVASIIIHKVSDTLSCVFKCLENARCISYNLAIFPDANDKYDCQLLATDKFGSSNKLMSSKSFSHYSIETPCESSPCQNGGTCRPVYEKGEYKCECAAGFVGTHCGAKALPSYQTLGCFKDTYNRAIPTLEGKDPILDGSYWVRQNAIEKCYQAAKKRGFKVFAVQNGGWCASSATAEQTYNKYGPSSSCGSDGKGGHMGNQVYEIQE